MPTKLRAQQIVIDIPREGEEAWIHVVIQEVQKDTTGKVLNIIPRHEFLHKSGVEIAQEVYDYADPILGTHGNISGYGLQLAIASAVTKWMQDIEGGEMINGDLIIPDEH